MRPVFIAHITGTRPHYIDQWTKPYLSAATARGQITRWVTDHLGNRRGDWTGRIFRIEHVAGGDWRMVPLEES